MEALEIDTSARVQPKPRISEQHVSVLDGLRGYAIVAVMWSHFVMEQPVDGPIVRALHSGWIGVNLFFLLTGYLITGILLDTRAKDNYYRNFYIRRALRIFPLHYGVLLAILVVIPLFYPPFRRELADIPSHQGWLWLFGTNFAIVIWNSWQMFFSPAVRIAMFWSLAFQEQFYLIWPVIVKRMTHARLVRVCIGLMVVAFLARAWIMLFGQHGYRALGPHLLTFCRMDDILAGALISVGVRRLGLERLRPWAIAGTILSALVMAKIFYSEHGLPQVGERCCLYSYTVYQVFFGGIVILALCYQGSPFVRTVLTNRFALTMCKYNYALYVFHGIHPEPFMKWMGPASISPDVWIYIRGVVWMGASLAVAFASWHLFEKHFVRLKSRFK